MSSKRLSPKSTGSCVRRNNRFEWRMRNLMSPCGMSQNFTEQVCRVNLYQSRQDVRSLPPKGVDRRRLRCRYHAVGCAASRDDPTGESASKQVNDLRPSHIQHQTEPARKISRNL